VKVVLSGPLPDLVVALVARRFRALGQPVRVRIIDHLERHGETNVQSLADALEVSQQNASRHLAQLADVRVVSRRREGRVVWYRLSDAGIYAIIHDTALEVVRDLRPGS
jgi:ArsR family transcriptional regulator